MIPAAFDYHAPKTLADAVALLERLGEGAKMLGGGQSLLPLLKLRLGQVSHLVDIGRIAGLDYIKEEGGFLRIGAGAQRWLIEAAAAGTSRLKAKMVDALALASLYGADELERALATAARSSRFGEGDLASILNRQPCAGTPVPELALASESHSLQPGTRAWEALR